MKWFASLLLNIAAFFAWELVLVVAASLFVMIGLEGMSVAVYVVASLILFIAFLNVWIRLGD